MIHIKKGSLEAPGDREELHIHKGTGDILHIQIDGEAARVAVAYSLGADFLTIPPAERKQRVCAIFKMIEQASVACILEIEGGFHMTREATTSARQ